MTRLLTFSAFAFFLAAVMLPEASAQQRPDRGDDPRAPSLLPDHERPYDLDPETGEVTLSPKARAEAEARVRARREARRTEIARLPQTERVRRPTPPPTLQRGDATIFTVDNSYEDADASPGDGVCATAFSDCSLRAAIQETNATLGTDPIIIEFAITFGPPGSFDPATGAWTFEVNSTGLGTYPTVTRTNVTIDGETQLGASCGLLPVGTTHDLNVVLDGSLTTSGSGLSSLGPFAVRGLVVQHFASGYGLALSGSNSLAECNYIGTDVDGEVAAPNLDGVFMGSAAANTVVRNNLVSGNLDDGLDVLGISQTVSGNFVGTDDDGNHVLGNGDEGLFVAGRDGLIDGNLVSGNVDRGIVLGQFSTFVGPATRMTLTNNTIGLDRLRGNAGYGNGDDGIAVIQGASDNDVGLPGGVNYIASHPSMGIYISGSGTDANRVRNNVIGLDLSGNAQPNGRGINVSIGPSGTVIGSGSDGNLIAGNEREGIELLRAPNTHIEGNTVGLNAAGTARGNGEHGILLAGASSVTIRGNIVASNAGGGIALTGSPSSGDIVIEGNRIGQAPDGTARGNGADGILCLDASDVRIGGTTSGQGNTITFNGQANPNADGVFVSDACSDVAILRNDISSNVGLGIDWCPSFPACDAVTPNDSPDADGITNYPVIASVENDGTDATITLSLDALPSQDYLVEFFRNTGVDPSGYGEGQVFITAQPLTTDASGHADLVVERLAGFFPVGHWVSATATPIDGATFTGYRSTSEFSAVVQVEDTSGPSYDLVASNTSPLTVAPGGSVSFAYSIANNTASAATGNLWFVAERGGSTVAQGVIRSGTLPGGATISGSYTQAVPSGAPSGAYTYRLRIGQFPSPVVDEEVFTVTVTGSARPGAEGWSLADVTPWTAVTGESRTEAMSREGEAMPTEASLTGAYPNPFSQQARVSFALPSSQQVRLAVYDVLGREVARLVDGEVEAGRHQAVLDGAAWPSGVYLVRLVTDAGAQTHRLTLVR